jgi:hypothetical protein
MTLKKIFTKHPLGKSGKNSELFERVDKTLKGKFSGNTYWYAETVKLD